MAGLLTHRAEIFGRRNETCAEKFTPEVIHRNARSQRVFGRRNPASKAEAIFRQIFAHGWKGSWRERCRDNFSGGIPATTD